jgi:hypothetical protein
VYVFVDCEGILLTGSFDVHREIRYARDTVSSQGVGSCYGI